ncbi:serine/threonine-protein kinase [Streptomyces sp. PSKA30]|uniref:serine/threonine-protein kinase n=1 Tax=Streptomyces sp. PSKA30 TaxID=2874597 RepID=UPI001CD0A20F|nr:serine/threonine-protein kinase [Streptomyces sp. PSKA30]MBZ9638768.1 protein kinase [Streptomyces sp. PSKA30]
MNQSLADEGNARRLAGRYRLVEQLGRGGMGTVWRAHDELLHREVAVKQLRASDLSPEERSVLHSRMQQEARAAARIKHPGVITVFDVLEESSRPWIVMELIDGRSLADIIAAEGTLLPRDAARVGTEILTALEQAHQLGVLHRDVKPANVLLERGGRVVLTDFGIALFEGAPGLTRTGDIVGSPDFLAPERAAGHRPGPPSDLWSLGATLYAAVEGQSPFLRTSTLRTLQAVISEPLPEPRHAGPLAPVIEALLRKEPEERPTAAQAQRMLGEVAAGAATSPETHPATQVVPPEVTGSASEGPASRPTQSTPSMPQPLYDAGVRPQPRRGKAPGGHPTDTATTVRDPYPGETPGTGPGRRTRLLATLAAVLVTAIIAGLAWALASKNDSDPSTSPPTTKPSASPMETASPEASPDPEMTKVWVTTFKDGPIRTSPSRNSERIGTLNAGRHYVFCRTQGATVTENGVYNSWWLWTELNEGGKKGWVSAYYINGNDQAEAEDGTDIPDCQDVVPGGPPLPTASETFPPPPTEQSPN